METKELIVVDSTALANTFSKPCPVCEQPIVYMASQSFCLCKQLYYHSKCLITALNKKQLEQQPKIQCLFCRYFLQVQFSSDFDVGCNRSRYTFKNFMTAGLAFLFCVLLIVSLAVTMCLLNDESTALSICISILLISGSVVGVSVFGSKALLTFCTRKRVIVSNIKPIDRSLEFSAFKDVRQTIDYNSDCNLDVDFK